MAPNVRAKRTVEADADWPRKDNSKQGLERPGGGCRSGSALERGVRPHCVRSEAGRGGGAYSERPVRGGLPAPWRCGGEARRRYSAPANELIEVACWTLRLRNARGRTLVRYPAGRPEPREAH